VNVKRLLVKTRQAFVGSAFWQRVLTRHRAHLAYRAMMVAHRDTLVATGALLKQQIEVYGRLNDVLRQSPSATSLSDQVIDLKGELLVLEAELALSYHGENEAKEAVAAAERYLDELAPSARVTRPW
jgi:hypothetical protein